MRDRCRFSQVFAILHNTSGGVYENTNCEQRILSWFSKFLKYKIFSVFLLYIAGFWFYLRQIGKSWMLSLSALKESASL